MVHFKSMFALDGKPSNLSENDVARTNTIANLLSQWGLLTLIDPEKSKSPVAPLAQIKIIPFKDKGNWQLVAMYTIGKKKRDVSSAATT